MATKPSNLDELYAKAGGSVAQLARDLKLPRSTVYGWVKGLAQPPVDVGLRRLRAAEGKLERLEAELQHEQQRRTAAERELADAVRASDLFSAARQPRPRKLTKHKGASRNGCTAVICATDWHLEKNIIPSTVSGLNEFNLNIAARRIDRLWKKAIYLIDFYRHIAAVDEIILWIGGDMIQGQIHEDDAESTFLGPAEAVVMVQDHLATGIDFIAKHRGGADMRVVCNYGNHSRTTKKTRHGTAWRHSWEWIAYKSLERIYKSIPFQVAEGYFSYTKVQGHTIRFAHGDYVKYNGGTGGLNVPMTKAIAAWDKSVRADYSFNGHFHTYEDHWHWTSVGCLCGYDAFAQSIKADYQPPTQAVVFIDKERGKTLACRVFVEESA